MTTIEIHIEERDKILKTITKVNIIKLELKTT